MQPLAGIKIVSVAFNLPGSGGRVAVGSLGADVIKVEPPGGDPLALHCPDFYKLLCSASSASSVWI